MAGEGGTTPLPPPPPPLRLKDLLELDCDSCSAAGFRCYPRRLGESASAPMRRHLLLESSPSLSLRRHRPSKLSHLSRSLSRRLSRRGGFWSRRRDEEADDDDAAATTTAASAGCGGSSSSSSSSSEELETSSSESSDNSSSGRTSRRSRSESDSDFSSATEDSVHHHPSQAAAAGDEHEVVVAMKTVVSKEKEGSSSSSGSQADDKEQLSPVGVMDFPFDNDDDEEELRDAAAVACSPSFSLARLHRRKTHKIRRFGSCDELAPLDLEARLATTSDPAAAAADDPPQQQMIQCRTEDAATPACAGSVHDVPPDEDDDLTSLLMGMPVSAGLDDDASERLVLDFFVEMKRRRRSDAHDAEAEFLLNGPAASGGVLRGKAERVVDGEAVAAAARGWLEGTGPGTERWGLADVLSGGAVIVAEMERGRRWMQVGEEEREVGAVVAGMLVDQLVIEVVRCLFV
ncbi:hypothetical protein BDA96_01G343700 [Sorghum bicolor]|uniref:DUF4378 domain-containing protein n=2 Tax=Sorghum bicolor TaxID=4558 RepID=A0A921V0C6_SORBI|nr:suppressor protein SRP40 [Sorghum bicolor]EER94623.1 hypothetical protein SORBI_3001G320500 [Sorghum bicolor]KAG0550498.1 hypothetical protein BDA96_01G343700 [Sorghum bicolor]|eukprot:XP_002467625.1 suppressor protein SRP40 [Sorghum bicolor]